MTHVQMDTRPWLTTAELAAAVGLSRFTLLREIQAGELKATRRGDRGHYRITWAEAERYAARTGILLAPRSA